MLTVIILIYYIPAGNLHFRSISLLDNGTYTCILIILIVIICYISAGNLHFRSISLLDNGTYTCMAANSLGSVEASAVVTVRSKLK